MQSIHASIPSPTVSVFRIGPLPVHLYALCIVAGILLALWLTDRRWRARGGDQHDVGDVAGWAVIFGIVGGRLYHVVTDPELYFTHGRHPLDALKIWDGGLGIWGAVALGGLGAYIGCRRHRLNFVAFADAAAPGIVIAQALGRVGNWFNNELYGRATTLPWKLQIHNLDVVSGKAARDSSGHAIVLGYFQPTFLYELLWDLAVGALLLWLDRRRRLGRGQVFLLYVMAYTVGRFWVEALREDHANHVLGMRVNSWVSIPVFLGALALFWRQRGTARSTAGRPGLGDPDSEPAVERHLDSPHVEHDAETAGRGERAEADPGPDQPVAEPAQPLGRHSRPVDGPASSDR
ncbi:MAG: prolipoprotein diacylglyceryl transferase [Jatrophihabitans sp.]